MSSGRLQTVLQTRMTEQVNATHTSISSLFSYSAQADDIRLPKRENTS